MYRHSSPNHRRSGNTGIFSLLTAELGEDNRFEMLIPMGRALKEGNLLAGKIERL
jgi:hypothetical protein